MVLFSNVEQRGCGLIRNTGGSLFIVMQVQKCGDLFCLGVKKGVWTSGWTGKRVFLGRLGPSLHEGLKGGSLVY